MCCLELHSDFNMVTLSDLGTQGNMIVASVTALITQFDSAILAAGNIWHLVCDT